MTDNENKNAKLQDQHHDGIEEHDHPLPGWWLAKFVLTIIFAVLYYFYYEMSGGPSTDQELAGRLAEIEAVQKEAVGQAFNNLDQDVLKPEMVARGQTVFAEKCFMCHGPQGQGLIGPNLTDNFWLHGNTSADILKVIQKGVPDKGMVPWEAVLSPEDQIAAVAFIKSLKGTNPSNPKEPQGTEYKD